MPIENSTPANGFIARLGSHQSDARAPYAAKAAVYAAVETAIGAFEVENEAGEKVALKNMRAIAPNRDTDPLMRSIKEEALLHLFLEDDENEANKPVKWLLYPQFGIEDTTVVASLEETIRMAAKTALENVRTRASQNTRAR